MRQPISPLPPLSLYIHIPWCIKKCPYCDFNSHATQDNTPERAYVDALLMELSNSLAYVQSRPLQSIFFGGGTPSLFSAHSIDQIVGAISRSILLTDECEITLEANPGTFEQQKFLDYRRAGINRLSIGVQSFNDAQLTALGRIHTGMDARNAIAMARQSGFDNINIDLMHGLPGQKPESALDDLEIALGFKPEHISWYQLTIENNTEFYKTPPQLPDEDQLWSIFQGGQQLLSAAGYQQYEVSAYAKDRQLSRHNLNYWEFGDYLGIGAGAHGKVTLKGDPGIIRTQNTRHPTDYLQAKTGQKTKVTKIAEYELIGEFVMNALRLNNGFNKRLFEQRTGLGFEQLRGAIDLAKKKGLLETGEQIKPTTKGRLFLNDLVSCFL